MSYPVGEAVDSLAGAVAGLWPPPGSIQGQAGWGSERPALVEGVPAHGRGLELDDL